MGPARQVWRLLHDEGAWAVGEDDVDEGIDAVPPIEVEGLVFLHPGCLGEGLAGRSADDDGGLLNCRVGHEVLHDGGQAVGVSDLRDLRIMVVADGLEAGLLEADREAATAGEQVDAPQVWWGWTKKKTATST